MIVGQAEVLQRLRKSQEASEDSEGLGFKV